MNDWHRIAPLLDELFELDAPQRSARLAAIAAEDVALAAELERLLAADAREGPLEAGAAPVSSTLLGDIAERVAGQVDAESGRAGRAVGHYRLLERLGAGGMGEVWRAERSDDFQQAVAVKLIRPLLDSPSLRERFARERRILARLDHPNIARLLDGGVAADGTPWYAMEFVRGSDIVRHANDQALDVRARVGLVLQVCDAVAHAQSLLIVHRDLKPSNLLVDANGRVRVLDFGIARLLDDTPEMDLTGTGVRVFSPNYAAPEQIRGEAVGTPADVFALGAVLYELLTGQPPHPARSAAPERLLASLADETAPRPSQVLRERRHESTATQTLTSVRDIVGDLDTIVATALQPEAQRRYVGAAQLAEDLRRWLDGRPIAAQPDTAGYRMKKFVARHRFAVGSASAVLLALVGGLGIALWQASVARTQAARADAAAAQVRAHSERIRKVKDFFVGIFTAADPIRRAADAPQTVAEALDAALERARSGLASDPVLQADVFDDFGEIRANQGRLDEAAALFEQAVAVAEKEYGPDHPVLAESLSNVSQVAYMRGRFGEVLAPIQRAVAILEKNDSGDPLALPVALSGLATAHAALRDYASAFAVSDRALALLRARAPDHEQLLPTLANNGLFAYRLGETELARTRLEEVVGLIERAHGPDALALSTPVRTLGSIAARQGDRAREAELMERSLALARANFSGDHAFTAGALADHGWQRVKEGRRRGDDPESDAGEALMRESVQMYERLGHAGAIKVLDLLATARSDRGDAAEAGALRERAWALCEQHGITDSENCTAVRAAREAAR